MIDEILLTSCVDGFFLLLAYVFLFKLFDWTEKGVEQFDLFLHEATTPDLTKVPLACFFLLRPCYAWHREVLEHFNLEIPEGREPTKEEEEVRQVLFE